MITIDDILDKSFIKDTTDEQKQVWLNVGLSRFDSLCNQYNIDKSKIPSPIPFIPKRIMQLCVLISFCSDMAGSEYQQVTQDINIDVYGNKKKLYEDELNQTLILFTPAQCGYTVDPPNEGASNNMGFAWGRA